jgi:hypothetical protein
MIGKPSIVSLGDHRLAIAAQLQTGQIDCSTGRRNLPRPAAACRVVGRLHPRPISHLVGSRDPGPDGARVAS